MTRDTSETRPKTIAIVGTDGSGKSSILARLRALLEQSSRRVAVLHSPKYHESPDAPLHALSRAMDRFSVAGDELRSFELKAAALFLQMTLFGPAERCMVQTFRPRVLVTERNPIVDSLAYGPLYSRMLGDTDPDPSRVEDDLRSRIDGDCPGGYLAIQDWLALENERLGRELTLWSLGRHAATIFERPLADAAAILAQEYRSALPDAVILLDVSGETAAQRVGARAQGTKELHEEAAALEALRQSYLKLMQALPEISPGLSAHVLRTDAGDDVDATLEEVLAVIG